MAIIETKKSIRPSTSVPPINRSTDPKLLELQEKMEEEFGPFTPIIDEPMHRKISYANGDFIVDGFHDETGLLLTRIATHANLDIYSRVETLISLEFDRAFKDYNNANGITYPTGQYSLTGIDAPFTCTTTYTYPSNVLDNYSLFRSFAEVIEASDKLTSFTDTGTQLIAVHTYSNSTDFTESHWKDFQYVDELCAGGVTRTISYSLVGSDA